MTITTQQESGNAASTPEGVNNLLNESLTNKFNQFISIYGRLENVLDEPNSSHLLSFSEEGTTTHPLTPTQFKGYSALAVVNGGRFDWVPAKLVRVSDFPEDLFDHQLTIINNLGEETQISVASVVIRSMSDVANIKLVLDNFPGSLIEVSVDLSNSQEFPQEYTFYYDEIMHTLEVLLEGYNHAIQLLENAEDEPTPSFKDPITPEEVVEDPKDEVTEFSEASEKQLQEEGIQKIMGEIQEFKELNGIGSTPLQEVRLKKYAEVLHSLIGQGSAVLSEFGLDNKTYGAFYKWITEGMGAEYLFQQYNLRIARRGDKGQKIGVWRTIEVPSYENRAGEVDFTRPRTRVEIMRALGGYVTHMWEARFGNGINKEQAAIIAAWNNFSDAVTNELKGTLAWRKPEDNKVRLAHKEIFSLLAENLISENGKSLIEILCPDGCEDSNLKELLSLLADYMPGFIEELKKDNHVELLRKYVYEKVFQHPDKDVVRANEIRKKERKRRTTGSGTHEVGLSASIGAISEEPKVAPSYISRINPVREFNNLESAVRNKDIRMSAQVHQTFISEIVSVIRAGNHTKDEIFKAFSGQLSEMERQLTSGSIDDVVSLQIMFHIRGIQGELNALRIVSDQEGMSIISASGLNADVNYGYDFVVSVDESDKFVDYPVSVKASADRSFSSFDIYKGSILKKDSVSATFKGERQNSALWKQTAEINTRFEGRIMVIECSSRSS